MYQGTQLSVNTYFAQLEKKTGLCEPFAMAKAMGVDLDHPRSERVPSFTLGVADVSPLEMAGAYATVAARGKYCAAQPVTKILNSSGKVFKNYKPQLPPGDEAGHRRHDQRHPARRDAARRVRPGAEHRQGVGRQDRHHPEQQGRLVRRLHPGSWPPPR